MFRVHVRDIELVVALGRTPDEQPELSGHATGIGAIRAEAVGAKIGAVRLAT
jgi:hypothetical protein